ncbi:MAG: laccase domain-containing protein [Desulfovibrio sp.]|nr:laccase domain-containing protein [Desulfovibrio sp.]
MAMSLMPLLFHFPLLPFVHCLFPLRDLSAIRNAKNSPYEGGNLSYEVGDSKESVMSNRRALLNAMAPLGLKTFYDLHQVHGDTLLFDPFEGCSQENDLATLPIDADGLATDKANIGLFIKTADCQPLLITDKKGDYLLALHIGWRGNKSRFIKKAVQSFTEHYKLKAQDLMAVRGPSLGTGKAEFVNFRQEWPEDFAPWYDPKTQTMDLWNLTRTQLMEAGLEEQAIFSLDLCTMSLPTLFSYRRDRICGRLGGIIWKEQKLS